METKFIKAVFDIDCVWEGDPPRYRVYVNDELFTERTWIWQDCYLTEILQIQALPGQYQISVQPVGIDPAQFHMFNRDVEHGSAQWIDSNTLEIL